MPGAGTSKVSGAELQVHERLLLEALRREDVDRIVHLVRWTKHGERAEAVREAGRWFLAAPGFREEGGYPDGLYELSEPPQSVTATEHAAIEGSTLTVTGHIFFRGIPSSECEIAATLHHVDSGDVVSMDVARTPTPFLNAVEGHPVSYADAGFRGVLRLDSEGLRAGRWRLVVTVQSGDLSDSRDVRPPPGFAPTRSSTVTHEGARTGLCRAHRRQQQRRGRGQACRCRHRPSTSPAPVPAVRSAATPMTYGVHGRVGAVGSSSDPHKVNP